MSQARPTIVVAGRHRPHEQLLLAYSALLGIAYLTGSPIPASIMAVLSSVAITAWSAALAISGVAALIGCWWRGERGLMLELGGLAMNAGSLCLYSAAVFTAAGWRALLPGGLVLAWAAANGWRAWQIHGEMRGLA
jgi:hypothetical protein